MSTPTTSSDWSWLLNTYWYVPEENLLAYEVVASTGAITPIQDQTVFQITGYDGGYFWGKTVYSSATSRAPATRCSAR